MHLRVYSMFQYLNSVLSPVDGFYVYYRATTTAGDYVKATVEGEKIRSFVITHLQPDTSYDIKIQSFTVGAASNFSSIITRKTLGMLRAPSRWKFMFRSTRSLIVYFHLVFQLILLPQRR